MQNRNSSMQNYCVYDMHTKDKIGQADSMENAMNLVVKDLKFGNRPGRCYKVYEGEIAESKTAIWFGDSWDVGQYLRENQASTKKQNEFTNFNAQRLFGSNVKLEPTDKEQEFHVTFKNQ